MGGSLMHPPRHMSLPPAMRISPAVALCALLLLPSCESCDSIGNAAPPVTIDHEQRMAWWREARFGMFLHWGLYAIPAGKWTDHQNHGEWIRTTAQIARDTYSELQARWDPSNFDADAWARMAKDAGMKYVVITSKHHDGFCLFDSDVSEWDVGNAPNKRDIMQELSDACRRHGLRFCTYHSIMDWHHPDYLPRRGWEKDRPDQGADFDRFERYLHAQVTEVITRYRPAVMWFDGEWEKTWTHERGVRLFELCRTLAPEMIVNNRVDVHRQGMAGFSASEEAVGDFDTPEQEIPATGLPGVDWESCMTMNGHWGWNKADTRWKSDEMLIRNLIDIASKGGNYLLNVGPRADGTFPDKAIERLASIGKWMRVNGESIRNTSASVFESLGFGRCTVGRGEGRDHKLYLHVFDWPSDGRLFLPGLANTIVRAYPLSDQNRTLPITASSDAPGLIVQLSQPALDPIASVIVVELDGPPIVYRTPTLRAEATQFVNTMHVTATGKVSGSELRYTSSGSEPTSKSATMPEALRLAESKTIKVALFVGERRVSSVVTQAYEKVMPLPPVKALAPNQGLRLTKAGCDWQTIPDDRTIFVQAPETVASIGDVAGPKEHTAHRFSGFLSIDEQDLYRFALTSDDGSKLWIDGQLVVDNDGLHGPKQKLGSIALAKGLHSFELIGFNATGGTQLDLKWARLGAAFAAIAAANLRN